jgi:hypothetical protein
MRLIDTLVQRQPLNKATAMDRACAEHARTAETAQNTNDHLQAAGYHLRRAGELHSENPGKNQGSIQAHEDAALRHGQAARTQRPDDKEAAREGSRRAHVLEADDRAMIGKLQKSINGVTAIPQTAVDLAVVNRYVSLGRAVNRGESVAVLKEAEAILAKVSAHQRLNKVEVRKSTYRPAATVEQPRHGGVEKPRTIAGAFNAGATGVDLALLDHFKRAGRFNPLSPNNRSKGPAPAGNRTYDFAARG